MRVKRTTESTAVIRTNFKRDQIRFDENDFAMIDLPTVETQLPHDLRNMMAAYDFEREDTERIVEYVRRVELERVILRNILIP